MELRTPKEKRKGNYWQRFKEHEAKRNARRKPGSTYNPMNPGKKTEETGSGLGNVLVTGAAIGLTALAVSKAIDWVCSPSHFEKGINK